MMAKRAGKSILIISAVVSLAAVTVAQGQQPGGMAPQAPGQPGQQQQMPGQPNYPGAQMPGTNPGSAPSPSDQFFVKSILDSDVAEARMGELAETKSQSPDVKQLGQKMVEISKRLDQQLKPLAEKMEVNMPKAPTKKEKVLIAKLENLSGPQFDESYIKAIAKDRQKDVKEFRSEAALAHDPYAQQAARIDGPVIAQHLQVIRQIAQKHNVTLTGKAK